MRNNGPLDFCELLNVLPGDAWGEHFAKRQSYKITIDLMDKEVEISEDLDCPYVQDLFQPETVAES